ncbi:MAG: Lar family restriction alleviation protein [Ruminococcus sp.]|nr:Lar family restriction alleviation protein [Ruminococcus sp.]
MSEYIEREKVYQMLHGIGGCDAEPESWANGWDKTIDTAISELEEIPAADALTDKIKLKPCPFCGEEEIHSEFYKHSFGEYRINIGCQRCSYCLSINYSSKHDCISVAEITEFTERSIEKWNTRSNKI